MNFIHSLEVRCNWSLRMMSSSNVSLSTGSFQNQAATVDALESASVPKTDGVKR